MARRILSLLLILAAVGLAASPEPATARNWVGLDGGPEAAKPAATVLNSDENETIIRFQISGFWSEELTADGATWQSLRFPGYFTAMDIGQAQLPVITELIEIPRTAGVKATVLDYTETTLSNYDVYPFQRPALDGATGEDFALDRAFYGRRAIYPESIVDIGDPAIWRDLRVIKMTVNPVRYSPAARELSVITDITVRLEYSGTDERNVKTATGRAISAHYNGMYGRNVLNYDPQQRDAALAETLESTCDYLIIAADALVDNLSPFIDWKTTQGHVVKTVPISQIGADTLAIKNYIAGEYAANGIQYVLLVGDETAIPGFDNYVNAIGYDTCFSDYYYTLVDGTDDYADLAIGRFSVTNSTELDNLVNKCVTFESNPPKGDWLERSLLIANKEYAPLNYQGCKELIRTAEELPRHTYKVLYPEFSTAYGAALASGGDEATNAEVVAAIHRGQRLINYRGHGLYNSWYSWNMAGQSFTTTDVDSIFNGEMTPVIFSIACLTNDLREANVCLGEAFTRSEDGAAAFLGATCPSWTEMNHTYDKKLYALIFNDGLNTIGDVSNEASVENITLYAEYGVDNARMYVWLGDPSMTMIYYGDPGPDAPELVSPAAGTFLTEPAQPTLDWDDVTAATVYQVQLALDTFFVSMTAEQEDLTVSEWLTPSLAKGVYFWRVRAVAGGVVGAWSETRKFYVGIEVPVLYAPASGTTVQNADSLVLEWYEVAGALGYCVQIDDNTDFSTPAVDENAHDCADGRCVFYITPPLAAETYYWRVKDAAAGMPWSDAWQLIIEDAAGTIMHVHDMKVKRMYNDKGKLIGQGTITIQDQYGNPVAGANVTADWNFSGMLSGSARGTTDDLGIAILYTRASQSMMGEWCFEVTNVTKTGAVYDSEANDVTKACESGWVFKLEEEVSGTVPIQFGLGQNYPNPFNPETEIGFSLPVAAHVTVEIFNVQGQRVASLADRQFEAGYHTLSWNAGKIASGVYLYRLTAGEFVETRKMLLLK